MLRYRRSLKFGLLLSRVTIFTFLVCALSGFSIFVVVDSLFVLGTSFI